MSNRLLAIFIARLSLNNKALFLFYDELLKSEHNLNCKFSYGLPFYFKISRVCYITQYKKTKELEISFTDAIYFHEKLQYLLDYRNRHRIASLTLKQIDEDTVKKINILIKEGLHYIENKK